MSRITGIGNGFPPVCSAARSDITNKPLDAPVGCFILQFTSHTVAVLRSLSQLVCPGRSPRISGRVLCTPSFVFCAPTPLVCRRFYSPRDPPTRKGQHRER